MFAAASKNMLINSINVNKTGELLIRIFTFISWYKKLLGPGRLGQTPPFEVTVTEELSLVLILQIMESGEVNSTFVPRKLVTLLRRKFGTGD